MTEHCANNGTSLCQTIDTTHLVLTYDLFDANRTLGFTYTGKQVDLMFHTTSVPDAVVYTVRLCVTNVSNFKWYVLAYENPYDATTPSVVKELDPHVEVELYAVKEPDFHKRDELILFLRIDYDDAMLGAEEIQHKQLVRLWQSLELLRKESEFADMTVNGVPAHRAVVAMASDILYQSVSALEYINHELPQDKQDVGDAATKADSNDCKELVPKKTNGEGEELGTRRLEELGASTSSVTKINNVKQKLGVQLATFAETVCNPSVYVIANVIEDLTEVVQELREFNHFKELELLDLKKPHPENYSLVLDVLNNECHLKAFLEYIYVGNIDMIIETTKLMIDNLMQAATSYNLPSLVDALQLTLIESVSNQNLQHVLQLAKKFDLDKLKLKAIDLVRSENVTLFDDPSLYQLVVSRPDNKYQRKASITCNLEGISSSSKWSYTFHIAGINVCLNIGINGSGSYTANCYLGLSLQAVRSPKCIPRMMTMIVTLRSTKGKTQTRKICHVFPSNAFDIKQFLNYGYLHSPENGYVINNSATLDFSLTVNDDLD